MITLIAAAGENDELGRVGGGNNALWDLPDDYNRFKELTLYHPVIMGRKTFGTLNDILEDRLNIVLTRNTGFNAEGVLVFHNIHMAIERALQSDTSPFVIGGGEIFSLGLPFADRIELTRIHAKFPRANAFFPAFEESQWKLKKSVFHPKDARHNYEFTYETWERM